MYFTMAMKIKVMPCMLIVLEMSLCDPYNKYRKFWDEFKSFRHEIGKCIARGPSCDGPTSPGPTHGVTTSPTWWPCIAQTRPDDNPVAHGTRVVCRNTPPHCVT